MILNGQLLYAFEKYCASDVVMQEGISEPRTGKDINRKYELDFIGNIDEFNNIELKNAATGENVTIAEWIMDITFHQGDRQEIHQTIVQTWKDDLIT